VRNQELWQLGEDGAVRESTNYEERVEPEREQQESVRMREVRVDQEKKETKTGLTTNSNVENGQ
jgi:hypothetical protein